MTLSTQDYPYSVKVTYSDQLPFGTAFFSSSPPGKWCHQHIGTFGRAWCVDAFESVVGVKFHFAREQDAVMFALRWHNG